MIEWRIYGEGYQDLPHGWVAGRVGLDEVRESGHSGRWRCDSYRQQVCSMCCSCWVSSLPSCTISNHSPEYITSWRSTVLGAKLHGAAQGPNCQRQGEGVCGSFCFRSAATGSCLPPRLPLMGEGAFIQTGGLILDSSQNKSGRGRHVFA